MAQQFKGSVRRGLRVVVLLHASQVNMLLKANPDLQGRISIIDVQDTRSCRCQKEEDDGDEAKNYIC